MVKQGVLLRWSLLESLNFLFYHCRIVLAGKDRYFDEI